MPKQCSQFRDVGYPNAHFCGGGPLRLVPPAHAVIVRWPAKVPLKRRFVLLSVFLRPSSSACYFAKNRLKAWATGNHFDAVLARERGDALIPVDVGVEKRNRHIEIRGGLLRNGIADHPKRSFALRLAHNDVYVTVIPQQRARITQ